MNQDVKQRWIAALRSGRYRQANNVLAHNYAGRDFFCCLGVLCDVLNVPYKIDENNVRCYGKELCHTFLPREAQEAAELDESPSVPVDVVKAVIPDYKFYSPKKTIELARLNDDSVPFNKIADVIEKAL